MYLNEEIERIKASGYNELSSISRTTKGNAFTYPLQIQKEPLSL